MGSEMCIRDRVNCDPAILETSCLINKATESDSLICGFTSSFTPISSLAVVLKGVRLLAPSDSPVVIGISCPTNNSASSLSKITADGVDKILESWSSLKRASKTAKLSSPLRKLPAPAIKPLELIIEDAAPAETDKSDVSSCDPIIESRSGAVSYTHLTLPTKA